MQLKYSVLQYSTQNTQASLHTQYLSIINN